MQANLLKQRNLGIIAIYAEKKPKSALLSNPSAEA